MAIASGALSSTNGGLSRSQVGPARAIELSAWRRDAETGEVFSLKLTAAGVRAISGEQVSPKKADNAPSNVAQEGAPREGSKLAKVVGLMRRSHGATVVDLMEATGWLAHTTRASITGLRKRGFAVIVDRSNKKSGTTYHIQEVPVVETEVAAIRDRDTEASKSDTSKVEATRGSRRRNAA
jgi:hypothetical protein